MEQSPSWKLNITDVKNWLRNTLVFLAPVAIIYLGSISSKITDNGLSTSVFAIDQVLGGAMSLYVLNVVLDLFRKLLTSKPE